MLLGMLGAYANNKTRFQIGNNENLFDYTYVGNVAQAHILAALALTSPKHADGVAGEAFFITNDSPIYFWDFARKLWAMCAVEQGKPVVEPKDCWVLPEDVARGIGQLLEWSFWLLGKTPRLTTKVVSYACRTRYFNCSKAKQRLGYTPDVGLEEGLRRGVQGYMQGDRWNTLLGLKA
jgi:sterol-4alpha-carboxylate 3-dehydrogenase (decarboxylating)